MPTIFETFEGLCLMMNTQPMLASKELQSFRDSPDSVEKLIEVLQCLFPEVCQLLNLQIPLVTSTSISSISIVESKSFVTFYTLSLLHYSLSLKWNIINFEKRNFYLQFFEECIKVVISVNSNSNSPISSPSTPSSRFPLFVLNKLINLYITLNKKSGETRCLDFFSSFISSNSSLFIQLIGYQGLFFFIQDIQVKNFLDFDLKFHDLNILKKNFEKNYLFNLLKNSIEHIQYMLSNSNEFFNLNLYNINYSVISLFHYLTNIINELISWDYSDVSSSSSTNIYVLSSTNYIKPQSNLRPLIISSTFLNSIFSINSYLTTILVEAEKSNMLSSQVMKEVQATRVDIHTLILTLASIRGPIFDSDSSESNSNGCSPLFYDYFSLLFSETIKFSEPYFAYSSSFAAQTSPSPSLQGKDYITDDIRSQSLMLFSNLFSTSLHHIGLSQLFSIPAFHTFFIKFSNLSLFLVEEIHHLCDQNLNIFLSFFSSGNTSVKKLKSNSNFNRDSLLNTWRFEVLEVLLESWSLLHHSYLLITDPDAPLTITNIQDNETVLLTAFLNIFSEKFFFVLQNSIIKIYLILSLTNFNEEENADEEELENQNFESLLASTCIIGRFSLYFSLSSIGQTLSQSFEEYKKFIEKIQQKNGNMLEIEEIENFYHIERLRLCLLFCQGILVDASYSLQDATTPQTNNSNNSVFYSLSSPYLSILEQETSCINNWILDAFHDNNQTLSIFFECLNFILNLFNYSISFLNSKSVFFSPYYYQTMYKFFSILLKQYMDPDKDLYNDREISKLNKDLYGASFNNILSSLMTGFKQIIEVFPYENELIFYANDAIQCISASKNKARAEYLINLGQIEQILLSFFNITNCNGQFSLQISLSLDGITNLTHTLSLLFLNANSSTGFQMLIQHIEKIVTFIHQALVSKSNNDSILILHKQMMACLIGLSKCVEPTDYLEHDLFADPTQIETLPSLIDHSHHLFNNFFSNFQSHILISLVANDDLLILYAVLLKNFSDLQLQKIKILSQYDSFFLFLTNFIIIFNKKFKNVNLASWYIFKDSSEEELGKNLILFLLEILNSLVTLIFSKKNLSTGYLYQFSQLLKQEKIAFNEHGTMEWTHFTLIFYCLTILLPFFSTELINDNLNLNDKFFNFLSSMIKLCPNEFFSFLNNLNNEEMAIHIFNKLIHLICSSMLLPSHISAKLSYELLNEILTHLINCESANSPSNLPNSPAFDHFLGATSHFASITSTPQINLVGLTNPKLLQQISIPFEFMINILFYGQVSSFSSDSNDAFTSSKHNLNDKLLAIFSQYANFFPRNLNLSDRIKLSALISDSFSMTLLNYLRYSNFFTYFQTIANQIISRQPEETVRQALTHALTMLITDRDFNLELVKKNRKQRTIFSMNFKDFLSHLRSLPSLE